jgi:predicted RNA-binding protein (virulence factor B family)
VIEVGRYQQLEVVRILPHGAYLGTEEESVLLPRGLAPQDVKLGEVLRVFVYSDSDDRLVATTEIPKAVVGQFAQLEVVDVTPHGVFVDWGLSKDLLVPYSESGRGKEVGDKVMVYVTVEERRGVADRVIGSARLGRWFDYDVRRLETGKAVSVRVFDLNDVGAQVIVDDRWRGIVYHDEAFRPLRRGDTAEGWITAVREDNRLDVTLRRPGHRGTLDAAELILAALEDAGGALPLHDRSSPDEIRRALHMSKKTFKRAVGTLMKQGRVTQTPGGIRRL